MKKILPLSISSILLVSALSSSDAVAMESKHVKFNQTDLTKSLVLNNTNNSDSEEEQSQEEEDYSKEDKHNQEEEQAPVEEQVSEEEQVQEEIKNQKDDSHNSICKCILL